MEEWPGKALICERRTEHWVLLDRLAGIEQGFLHYSIGGKQLLHGRQLTAVHARTKALSMLGFGKERERLMRWNGARSAGFGAPVGKHLGGFGPVATRQRASACAPARQQSADSRSAQPIHGAAVLIAISVLQRLWMQSLKCGRKDGCRAGGGPLAVLGCGAD